MFVANKKKILQMIRDIHNTRLNEAINEVDVFDDRGNMILGKDLKVRHKDSGYEYTIADVKVDPKGDNTEIVLRLPEEPRVEPEGEEGVIVDRFESYTLGEDDAPSSPGDLSLPQKQLDPIEGTGDPDDDEVFFVIDKEKFEKEYEVK